MRGAGQNGLNPPRKYGLEIKDRLWAFIDAAIGPKNQESIETTSEPAIVSNGKNRSFILIEGMFK
jgi:hypothetical protein